MRRRAKVLARESRAVRRFEAGAKKRKGKKIKYELKNERNLKKRLDRLENKNKKYRQGLLKEQNNLMEERDQVFGQAKQELEERLEMIELQLDKDNCLENSDGERECGNKIQFHKNKKARYLKKKSLYSKEYDTSSEDNDEHVCDNDNEEIILITLKDNISNS